MREVQKVRGWGLRLSKEVKALGGELVEVAPATGCASERCNHLSHDPAAPTYEWIPPQGSKMYLLGVKDGDNTTIYYFYLRQEDGSRKLLEFHNPLFYWAWMDVISLEDAPEWVLERLEVTV